MGLQRKGLLLLVCFYVAPFSHGSDLDLARSGQCTADTAQATSWDYSGVFKAPPPGPPGFTRSVYERDHALISSESRVWAPLAGWTRTLTAHLVSPSHLTGAKFSMFLAEMQGGGTALPPSPGMERVIIVLGGSATVTHVPDPQLELTTGMYAFLPAGSRAGLHAAHGADMLVYEQLRQLSPTPSQQVLAGAIDALPVLPVPGEVFQLRKLLPATADFDFNVHVMDFEPGEYLVAKECHYNQHGLLLVQGEGIYRLGSSWYPVQAGDAIYMAPYVVQWYGAMGKQPSRYILYKDTTVDPATSSLGLCRCIRGPGV